MSLKPQIMYTNGVWLQHVAIILFLLSTFSGSSQQARLSTWEIPDTLHHGRFWAAATTGAVTYTATLFTLKGLWYDKYPRTSFHFFNDINEWQQMDKAGHMFTAYFEADWLYGIARWTGMKKRSSIITSSLVATGLQGTIEMLDGFSSEWGFSINDFAFNLAGSGLWATQQVSGMNNGYE